LGLVGLGVLTIALSSAWPRALARTGLALIAATFLIGGEVTAGRAARQRFISDFGLLIGGQDGPNHVILSVQPGYGFWLAVLLLAGLAGVHLSQLVRLSRPLPTTPAAAIARPPEQPMAAEPP
jgi:hypothetical protein